MNDSHNERPAHQRGDLADRLAAALTESTAQLESILEREPNPRIEATIHEAKKVLLAHELRYEDIGIICRSCIHHPPINMDAPLPPASCDHKTVGSVMSKLLACGMFPAHCSGYEPRPDEGVDKAP